MWNLIFLNDTNELIYKTNRLSHIGNKLMVTKEETWWRGINHTAVYKTDNQQGPTV